MKRNAKRSAIAITLAFLLGSIATTLTSGCQKQAVETESPDLAPPTIDTGTPSTTSPTNGASKTEPTNVDKSTETTVVPDASEPAASTTPGTAKPSEDGTAKGEPTKSEESKDEPKKQESTEPTGKTSEPASKGDSAASAATDTTNLKVHPSIDKSANPKIQPGDWAQWGGSTYRNNVPEVTGKIPTEWTPGEFDRKTGKWLKEKAKNVKWVAMLGSQSYGNPVVAGGQVYVGTNNGNGYLKRYPSEIDLGCLIAFRESDGEFLWQHSSEKLPSGRVNDWMQMGICCAPYVEGDRLWFVTSRGEVRCLDTQGFRDGEDDGPVQNDLAKILDIVKNDDPTIDDVAPIVEQLNGSKISDELKTRLAGVNEELADGASVKVDAEGKKWTISGTIRESKRTLTVMVQGPRLVVSKLMTPDDKDEADVVWAYDMMKQLEVFQHNMCSCSVTAWGDILFVCTSNGVDESHINIPAPHAPSFMAMNKHTGEVYWTDASPGLNIHHGQWTSPTVAMLGGVPQVLFGGGDGWLYSFKADTGKEGKPELLWKFDCNPKDAKLILGGRGTRNDIIGTPVVYDGLVYIAVGQDPEHAEGIGHMWCIDPNKRGDVSSHLAVRVDDRDHPIPHRREQAVNPEKGEIAIDNPNSAAVWHYAEFDRNGDKSIDFEETMHRTCGTVAIKNDLLFVADFSGLIHCLDAKSGKVHWTYDMLAAAWASPLIVGDHVYIGDEDGDVAVFELKAEQHEPVAVMNMLNSVYSTAIVANNTLFIANKTHIFAIQDEGAGKEESSK